MLILLTWAFETFAAAILSGMITGIALFVGLALWLHQGHDENRTKLHPFYAETSIDHRHEG